MHLILVRVRARAASIHCASGQRRVGALSIDGHRVVRVGVGAYDIAISIAKRIHGIHRVSIDLPCMYCNIGFGVWASEENAIHARVAREII